MKWREGVSKESKILNCLVRFYGHSFNLGMSKCQCFQEPHFDFTISLWEVPHQYIHLFPDLSSCGLIKVDCVVWIRGLQNVINGLLKEVWPKSMTNQVGYFHSAHSHTMGNSRVSKHSLEQFWVNHLKLEKFSRVVFRVHNVSACNIWSWSVKASLLLDSLSVVLDWFTADLVKKSLIGPCLLLCCESSKDCWRWQLLIFFFFWFYFVSCK